MNRTQNYHLPQWDASDRIMMQDFNAAMASIENGVSANASVAAKAQAGATAAGAAAAKAQSTADAARSAAQKAQSTADTKPYVTGHYTGNGQTMEIRLGFRPKFLIISGMQGAEENTHYIERCVYSGYTGGNALESRVEFTSTGFRVLVEGGSGSKRRWPRFQVEGRAYDYIAFK